MAMTADWAHVSNVLAVRLDSMGDVLMTTPALAAMRRSLPQARITLLTSEAGIEAAERVEAIDESLVYAAPWMATGDKPASVSADLDFIAKLTERRFDAAIIFTVCTQSALPAALACRLANIPLRLAHARENPYALLTNWVPDTDIQIGTVRHEVQRQLDLVGHIGCEAADNHLKLRYGSADVQQVRERMAAMGGSIDQPYLVIHPGANAASRRYPASHFAAAARMLEESARCQLIFTGSEHEKDLIAEAASQLTRPAICLPGQLKLGELAALIAGARALLCNNTGPAHIAAAVGTPVVVLYALTNPQHTPWKVSARILSHDVPCRNCLKSRCPQTHHDCLERISPQSVSEAVLELLRQHRTTQPVSADAAPQDRYRAALHFLSTTGLCEP